jgi:hypothetical protein
VRAVDEVGAVAAFDRVGLRRRLAARIPVAPQDVRATDAAPLCFLKAPLIFGQYLWFEQFVQPAVA